MNLTVLVDNNTLIGTNYLGEPAFSLFIEDNEDNILFDTGYSDIFLRNALKMKIDINSINYVVLSHGHLDHTWGLSHLMGAVDYYGPSKHDITLLAHPSVLTPKEDDGEQIGILVAPEVLKRSFRVVTSKDPYWLNDRLVFLGEIERKHHFENKKPIGLTCLDGETADDYLLDDTALVYKSKNGLVIITGCSHSGICNIVDYAKKICCDSRIADIIGGLHLLNPSQEVMHGTMDFIRNIQPLQLHACHCTDLQSKIELSKAAPLFEIGVGCKLNYD